MERKRMTKKEWQRQLDELKKLQPPVIERKNVCYHEHLQKVVLDDLFYQCTQCKTIIHVVGSALYEPKTFLNLCIQIAEYISKEETKE